MVYRSTSKATALLVYTKDKDPMASNSGAIYWFHCGDLTCDDMCIGKTSRIFGERFKEHLKEHSPIHHHSVNTDLPTTHHNFQIIGKKGHCIARTITDSMYIRVNNPTLNKNKGKYNLCHIWDRVLLTTPGLKIKRQVQAVGHAQNIQPNFPTPLNQPNTPIPLSQPSTSMKFSQVLWRMLREHPCLIMCKEPPRTYIRHSISVLPQT